MKSKTYQIRFNTQSTSDSDRWRLVCDGEEILVSNIYIDSQTYTTKDHIEGLGDKWHVTATGYLEIKNGEAYIKPKRLDNPNLRHIAKAITWRIIGTLDTIIIGWILTGNLKIGLGIGGLELFTKMFLYYLHERVWYKSNFGLKSRKKD
jgi:uncharacterized membrane protein